jgi:hypothetical protein
MTDHGLLALLVVVAIVILGIVVWMVRDFHKDSARWHEQMNGVLAANFLQGRQIKEVVEEARQLLRDHGGRG